MGPQSSHAPPHIQLPMLVPKGTPRPALTCLVVVIDLHLGWLQALHRDVPLHREGKAQGLGVQLGKGSNGGLGVPLHLPWSVLVSPHWPHSTNALPATSALGPGGVCRTTGLAEGQGETLGPFPTLGDPVAGGRCGLTCVQAQRENLLRAGMGESSMQERQGDWQTGLCFMVTRLEVLNIPLLLCPCYCQCNSGLHRVSLCNPEFVLTFAIYTRTWFELTSVLWIWKGWILESWKEDTRKRLQI